MRQTARSPRGAGGRGAHKTHLPTDSHGDGHLVIPAGLRLARGPYGSEAPRISVNIIATGRRYACGVMKGEAGSFDHLAADNRWSCHRAGASLQTSAAHICSISFMK